MFYPIFPMFTAVLGHSSITRQVVDELCNFIWLPTESGELL